MENEKEDPTMESFASEAKKLKAIITPLFEGKLDPRPHQLAAIVAREGTASAGAEEGLI